MEAGYSSIYAVSQCCSSYAQLILSLQLYTATGPQRSVGTRIGEQGVLQLNFPASSSVMHAALVDLLAYLATGRPQSASIGCSGHQFSTLSNSHWFRPVTCEQGQLAVDNLQAGTLHYRWCMRTVFQGTTSYFRLSVVTADSLVKAYSAYSIGVSTPH